MKDIYKLDNLSVVIDNNVLCDLYELGCLNNLFEVFDKIIIPQVIYDKELLYDIEKKLESYKDKFSLGIINTQEGLNTYGLLVNNPKYSGLSFCDKHAISIAKERHVYLSSNDGVIRKACQELGIKYTGVLGILGRIYYKNKISKSLLIKKIYLLKSNQTTCYISSQVIKEFKKEIGI